MLHAPKSLIYDSRHTEKPPNSHSDGSSKSSSNNNSNNSSSITATSATSMWQCTHDRHAGSRANHFGGNASTFPFPFPSSHISPHAIKPSSAAAAAAATHLLVRQYHSHSHSLSHFLHSLLFLFLFLVALQGIKNILKFITCLQPIFHFDMPRREMKLSSCGCQPPSLAIPSLFTSSPFPPLL